MSDIVATAIEEALKGNYKKAIELNKAILKENPNNIEALNRLAFALAESGLIRQAKQVYNKVLAINRFNSIALKNIKRLALLKSGKARTPTSNGSIQQHSTNSFSTLFLEEVGKTKILTLINPAEAKVLLGLHPTNPVLLIPRRRGVAATTTDGTYIGALPDDIARRLYTLIKGGNKYEAYIKSVDRNEVTIFIREILRKPKFRNQPSFLGKGSAYYSFVREEAFSDEEKPDTTRLEDLDEATEEGEVKDSPAEEEAES